MKKTFLVILAALLVITAGCSAAAPGETQEGKSITVYYLNAPDKQLADGLLRPVQLYVPEDSDSLHAALAAVSAAPEDSNCVASFPRDLRINSYSLSDGVLAVNLNSKYKQLEAYEKSVLRACLVLTLCGIDEVDSVSVYVDATPEEELLTPEDILFSDTDESDYERQISLYFADSSMTFLHMERHNLTIGQNRSICGYVVDELCRGPQGTGLAQTMPEGTEVLSVKQTGDVCTVDLSYEFYGNRIPGASAERMTVYSIVNSLCSINGVKAVQILIDGAKIDNYGHIPLSAPLKYEPLLDQDSYDIQSDTVQTLYLRIDDGSLTEFPVMINRDKYLTREETALRALMNITTTCGCYSPVSEVVELRSVTIDNRVCTAVFSETLVITGSSDRLNRTLEAIANTLYACGNADRIIIKAGDTVAFNREMDGPEMTYVSQ